MLCVLCADVHGGREGHDDVSFYGHQSFVRFQSHQHSSEKSHLTSLPSISFTSFSCFSLLLAIELFVVNIIRLCQLPLVL